MCELDPCLCSCELTLITDISKESPIGSFMYIDTVERGTRYKALWVKLPAKGGSWHALPLYLKGRKPPALEDKASWEWDGNREKPTLLPSVKSQGLWHGEIFEGFARSLDSKL